MKFYNRELELAELKRIQLLAFESSKMTVVTGRRRIGKTSLIVKATEGTATVYLFVGRKNEAVLVDEFVPIIRQSLDVFVPDGMRTFRSLFQYLMEIGMHQSYNLIIDEFQEFYTVNKSVFSDIQNLWDQYRKKTRVNLIVSGSVYSLMHKIFQEEKEPLFGRADNILKLYPFKLDALKEIMRDYAPSYTNDDLLAMFCFTGGVPKYLELFCDNGALTIQEMIQFMVRDNSPFTDEGKNLLIAEFGKNYATYFSILDAIANSRNTQSEIESALGGISVGGYLKRLEEDYNVIARTRPIFSKEGSQSVRFEIVDNFLKFWFKYFDRNRSYLEIKNFAALRKLITDDYTTYSGKMLEKYFIQKMAESLEYREIGSWWEPRGNQNELDIVALKTEKNRAVVVEVKRQRKEFKPEQLAGKMKHLKEKVLPNYKMEAICFCLEDM
ncbi:MAG: ATP-binding protein [Bacteroidia bacterium]|nr:ATP-binding protein [Bacteroidia bacterium]